MHVMECISLGACMALYRVVSGAWVWLIITLFIVSCTDLSGPVLFTPVQQFYSTCPHTFYTCSTLNFLGKISYYIYIYIARFCDYETINDGSRGVFH